uniref:Uncharacterized protein n=1 Tax=Knipowitschia caucasica TaxID=637954 RepID=A0AAV2KXE2_KNICA
MARGKHSPLRPVAPCSRVGSTLVLLRVRRAADARGEGREGEGQMWQMWQMWTEDSRMLFGAPGLFRDLGSKIKS